MQDIQLFFNKLSGLLWGWPMIIILLGTHVFLTIRLKFPQRKIFRGIALSVKSDGDSKGDVSQFGALATALAATIGTGNIIGVATAVSLGGPGAVLWCWLSGVFGIATKYSEGLLAVKYRVKTSDGTMLGGPMYALERGLGMKWLAVLFCVFTIIAALGIGCSVQSNSISTMLKETFNISKYVSGSILTVMVAAVIFFGIKGIARVCGFLVPFMAFFYVVGCVAILIMNAPFLGRAITLIFRSAFSVQAVGGGMAGGGLMIAMRYGIARGLFSNESGMGSAPIVAAAAKTKNPVRQALVSATGTFWDTVVVCALTGLVLVTSIIRYPEINYSDGALLTKMAFSKISFFGPLILTVGLITFAFSTILGWSYYAEKAIEYLGGKKAIVYYRILWVAGVFLGSVAHLSMIWDLADSMNALMAIPNLISLLLLSGILARETNKYLWSGKLNDNE
ncbi:MAG: alanine/glycine:cation symporter family protein [Bacteroidales bacterium]|nr:alanine/glycine:cation symporter family protein [Bacteroidales bacterium]MDD3099711.1 alanine/glycine:cation symporter family protein [Bacteroidales bacterium]MDD3943418.1 alanine/glycine:cation symporter family protein [Bacteroidales bacterium]MDD5314624.1 alanine/glycine:cation symporter family protein [Bacteroidales bacterium]